MSNAVAATKCWVLHEMTMTTLLLVHIAMEKAETGLDRRLELLPISKTKLLNDLHSADVSADIK